MKRKPSSAEQAALEAAVIGFSWNRWYEVWNTIPRRTKDQIRAKAEWERMSTSAVVREWWPEIWKRIENAS